MGKIMGEYSEKMGSIEHGLAEIGWFEKRAFSLTSQQSFGSWENSDSSRYVDD
jgi:hypothetical protein